MGRVLILLRDPGGVKTIVRALNFFFSYFLFFMYMVMDFWAIRNRHRYMGFLVHVPIISIPQRSRFKNRHRYMGFLVHVPIISIPQRSRFKNRHRYMGFLVHVPIISIPQRSRFKDDRFKEYWIKVSDFSCSILCFMSLEFRSYPNFTKSWHNRAAKIYRKGGVHARMKQKQSLLRETPFIIIFMAVITSISDGLRLVFPLTSRINLLVPDVHSFDFLKLGVPDGKALEDSIGRISLGHNILTVNIARFQRKPLNPVSNARQQPPPTLLLPLEVGMAYNPLSLPHEVGEAPDLSPMLLQARIILLPQWNVLEKNRWRSPLPLLTN
ncbi:hypothetical protein L2E82_31752 [Cichorium intybus]|uniref:Uncharacterized protein n=1 Tax=Cichorium intybus TaxID=13427 RepID=A0ACB9BFP9_CICIN|nr:hypothetical protein L2E82_31752 [Cichorium intybus]